MARTEAQKRRASRIKAGIYRSPRAPLLAQDMQSVAARAMLDTLKGIRVAFDGTQHSATLRVIDAAIAQAEAAGITS